MTRAPWLNVLRRNVSDPAPGESRWHTVVVLERSIAIITEGVGASGECMSQDEGERGVVMEGSAVS